MDVPVETLTRGPKNRHRTCQFPFGSALEKDDKDATQESFNR